MAGAARAAGWTADEVPMSDGGEGLLLAMGGVAHTTLVTGPLGAPVEAEWRMLDRKAGNEPLTAVVEMSRAAGRALLPRPRHDDPVRATTAGVGQLLLAARDAGARRIVVGCGGSSTTDGGLGAYEAVGSPTALRGIELVVACDVTTRFGDAAAVFGPQKGATAAQVVELGQRLVEVAARYRRETGIDVTGSPGRRGGGRAGGRARRPRRPDRARLRPRGRAGRPRAAGWSGPTWPSPERGTSIPRRSTARCRAACSSSPAPGVRTARPCRSSASPAARTRRSSPHRRRGSTWSASPLASAGPGPGRRRPG